MISHTDQQLLRDYTERQSEAAFAELARRHVDFVYSAALRMVRDAHLAEDVTQGVFLALAQNARQLADRPVLSGWLHRTAQNLAANAVRSDVRRRAREQEAAVMNELLSSEPDASWEQVAPHLDAALGELSDADHDALLLRYFEHKSAREMAQTFGTSEEAAQKRVSRAVERLREFFAKRGVTVGASGLVVVISANAVQAAPVSLAKGLTAVAIAKGVAAAGSSTLTTITEALKIMAWSKTKTAIVVGVGILLASGTATIVVREIQRGRTFAWQDMVDGGEMAMKALDTTPPQVTIVRSKFPESKPHQGLWANIGPIDQWRYIGVRASPLDLVRAAYEGDIPLPPLLASEIILPPDMPGGFYDFIANLPNGSRDALAAVVRTKFSLDGSREMREMEVLLLQVDRLNAAGLKPGTPSSQRQLRQGSPIIDGKLHYQNHPISKLAARLESQLDIPVIDQTGLAGNYDFIIPENFGVAPAERIARANQALHDELGLKLVSNRQPHEVLVIEKVKPGSDHR